MAIFKFYQEAIGIDMGTANTVIADKNGIILVDEPSLVAINLKDYEVVAVGSEAKAMIGKTPENIAVISPIENGVIVDYESTCFMLSSFIKRARPSFSLFQPDALVCVSSRLSDVEKRSVEDCVHQAGARRVKIIDENISGLRGMGFDVDEAKGRLILNIGAGKVEASLVSLGGLVTSHCEPIGGESIITSIRQLLKRDYNLNLGFSNAEAILFKIGSLNSERENNTMLVSGNDLLSNMPKSLEISSKDIAPCILPVAKACIDSLRKVLEKTPPDLSADIVADGIYMVGGLSYIDYLADYIKEIVKMEINLAENPLTVCGVGAGLSLLKEEK
ncbi:MAG: rod shape-determining protein [Finegoldia sp.]|nr:rod shape-determining protein [Finegoldia sp.]